MLPDDNLLAVLQDLMEAEQPVRLLNHYRGLPVSNDAWITAIDQGAVTLRVYPDQAVCMVLENKTCLMGVLPASRTAPTSFWAATRR